VIKLAVLKAHGHPSLDFQLRSRDFQTLSRVSIVAVIVFDLSFSLPLICIALPAHREIKHRSCRLSICLPQLRVYYQMKSDKIAERLGGISERHGIMLDSERVYLRNDRQARLSPTINHSRLPKRGNTNSR